jgi:hypothetical protein
VPGDLVPRDTNARRDFFVRSADGHDRAVSVACGTQATNDSDTSASISTAGRAVAFQSLATNLVAATRTPPATSSCAASTSPILGVDTNLFGDGTLDDDAAGVRHQLEHAHHTGPADAVSVADGMAAFSARVGGRHRIARRLLERPDGDQDDLVVHL